MIEKNFDVSFIADLALREKQIQQNYRPIIAVHKWFARRPGTLFRGLLLSEFSDGPLRDVFYRSNDLSGIRIADPFMGGGTPLLEANRMNCDVVGFDINPMAYWIVKQEIEHLDLSAYGEAAESLRSHLANEIGHLYRTKCNVCGDPQAHVKYFLWVKTIQCSHCAEFSDLFPGYLISSDVRHPKNVFVCPTCWQLSESDDKKNPGKCGHCGVDIPLTGPASRNRLECSHCGEVVRFPNPSDGPPKHRLFAIEYHCASCRYRHTGRFFKSPDEADRERAREAETRWSDLRSRFVPSDEIPTGDETNRLHRWGYRRYREMFNPRQLLGLELSARLISRTKNERIKNALATNLSDLLRYQNMLCRYDSMALKSLDIFSVHGFPVGLIQCESNFLGIFDSNKNTCIGSGGWKNITEKYRKAKSYCDSPYEVRHDRGRKELVPITDEWIGDQFNGESSDRRRCVEIHCADSSATVMPKASLDAVITDPPYFGNVQYAELMDFCYVWLRRLIGKAVDAFENPSTRNSRELTGNVDMGRDLEHFTEGLSAAFQNAASALKPGAPFSFTYHHNKIEAYVPVAVAILDSGLTCSAALPCPAEMGASIHINGTASSIIDTVFVCRTTGVISRRSLTASQEGIATLIRQDLEMLQRGNVRPTIGDTRCIAYGHLIRLAIWNLRKVWNKTDHTHERIRAVSNWLQEFGRWSDIKRHLDDDTERNRHGLLNYAREQREEFGDNDAYVPF